MQIELDFIHLAAILGTVTPLFVSLFKGANMTRHVKQAVALVVSLVVAVVSVGATNSWEFDNTFVQNLLLAFPLVFTEAQAFYRGLWEDTTIETKLESIGSNS